jgi:uncharacterized membrane protein YdbT with pleckstrin-like domain
VERDQAERVLFQGHPSWRSMVGFHFLNLVWAIVVGVIAGLLSAAVLGHVSALWVVAGVLVVFALGLGSGQLRRSRTTYTITNRRLTIEVGLLARDVHETRLEHVQNVRSSQSALERSLGVGTVAFDTAARTTFDFSFRGVAQPRQIARAVDQVLHERTLRRV